MIIDGVGALKSWLAKLLEPICDADPVALADYVAVLVKKDKPEKELKVLCADLLDVFLEKETTGFVDKLFQSLIAKDYMESLDKDVKEIFKVKGKSSVEKFKDKKEAVAAEEDRAGGTSPLGGRLNFSESRTHGGRRREGRRSRDWECYGKNGDSHREPRGRRAGRSRSRDRERTWEREHRCKLDVEKSEAEGFRLARAQCSSERGAIPGSAAVAPIHLPDSTTESWSRYYSGRGEDGAFIRSTPLKHSSHDYYGTVPLPPPPSGPAPPAHLPHPGTRVSTYPPSQPPPPGIFPVADKYDQDGRSPEASGIVPVPQNHHFISHIQTLRPNLIGLTSADSDMPNSRGANIVIQTERLVSAMASNPARQNYSHQHKPDFQKRGHYGNTKLEIRKIPRELNNIAKLNGHFSKFGTVISIQVMLGSDPEAALIQYATKAEACRAISSTEAVLNNRFIKVYWHRDSGEQPEQEVRGPSMPLSQEPVSVAKKALKLQQDMTQKKQEMLEMQMKCQKALLNKLEKLKGVEPEERADAMRTLKELMERISQLKDELKPPPAVLLRAVQSKPQTDASRLGLIPEVRRKAATLRRRGSGRGGQNRMVVDHRPRTLAVLGATGEKADLMAHFGAANQGAEFKGRLLRIAWWKAKAAPAPSVQEAVDPKEEKPHKSPIPEEEEDEDEEDKHDSRPWRR